MVRFIGSVKFAVPVLTLVAAGLIWGTWIDSTVGREAAFHTVYGSLWFIGLMLLVCASLVVSVVVRYPWRRKHVGFIIVHASLITLIFVGFYTMFTKVEGRIVLQEGETSSYMQLDKREVASMTHGDQGQGFTPVTSTTLDKRDRFEVGGAAFRIDARWGNSKSVTNITNDAPTPLHAVEISTEPGATEGDWVGEIPPDSAAPSLGAFAVRVVPTGQTWTPPQTVAEATLLDKDSNPIGLPAAGTPIGESGWTVTSIDRFERATIGAGGLTERDSGPANPAIRVMVTGPDGSVERHIAFERFRESPFRQQVEGTTVSPFSLTYRGESFTDPTLAVMRDADGKVHALYAKPGEEPQAYEHTGDWPWILIADNNHIAILHDFERAQANQKIVEAPEEDSNRPALVVTPVSGGEAATLLWNQPTPVDVGGKTMFLQYGPVTHPLPFTIQLVDFRKSDYPGSEMAMAFESDVKVTTAEKPQFDFNIHMNHPYTQGGWKVYQSGFVGDDVTVLQVTRDPGLVLMYVACSTLVLGIILTFYSRSLSWGHPDIPVPFTPTKE
ncbi:MAG: cytochrome c biogenesis protein ResB [Phycisphaerales bacterium]|nr:cytochrome c biogenesis protein ResB [Phycisphaerales bacterium]